MTRSNAEDFELIEDYGIIGRDKNGETTHFRFGRWYHHAPKYDLRRYKDGKAQKGITLTREELVNLRELLSEIL